MSSPKIRTAAERSANDNFEAFVASMRIENPLGVPDWSAMCWDLGQRKRVSSGRKDRIWFNKNFVKKVTEQNAEPFPVAFGDLARAVVCTRELGRAKPLDSNDHMVLVRAFRYLYSCAERRADHPTCLTRFDFDEAASACRVEAASSAYRIGCKLQEIAATLDRKYLTPVRLNWVNPIPRDSQAGGALQNRTSRDFFDRRESKLPSEELLNTLAAIANRDDLSPPDLLRQRAVELLVCGGFRCNELLMVPRDIWVEEPQKDSTGVQVLDRYGVPVVRYGLRYVPEKGGHHETQIKWLPTPLVDVARRAVHDIQRITEPFVQIARFMHKHPGRTLLPEPWHSMPGDALLNMHDVASMVGLGDGSGRLDTKGRQFVTLAKLALVATQGKRRSIAAVTKAALEAELRKRSAASTVFPMQQSALKLHECLFLVGVNFIGSGRSTLNGTVTLLTQGQFDDYLTDRSGGPRSVEGSLSIFSRLGYVDSNGSPLSATTHQFRHWLNTLAQEGGLSQVEISRWMGRRTIDDNAAYDHQTGFQLAKRITLDSGRQLLEFAPLLVEMLRPYPSVEIVLTTSWLQALPVDVVISYLPQELAQRVVDTTKNIKPRLSYERSGAGRTDVIVSYTYGKRLKNWLALDDSAYGASKFGREPGELMDHFLLLDSALGISDDSAQRRIRQWLIEVHGVENM